jgi:chitinase
MPANQIMLGIAAYGYLQLSTATKLRTRRRGLDPRATVTVYNPNGGIDGGQVNFASLVDQGALAQDWSGKWVGAGGFTREWDACSSTPWLKSWASGQIITYDDPDSISMKAQFAKQAGLRGTAVWEITGDMGGSNWSLLSAARSGLGI